MFGDVPSCKKKNPIQSINVTFFFKASLQDTDSKNYSELKSSCALHLGNSQDPISRQLHPIISGLVFACMARHIEIE